MDAEDFLVSSNILPLGSLTYVLFCVRKNGWGWDAFLNEVNTGSGSKLPAWIRGYMTYALPALVCLIYLKGYYDTFSQKSLPVFCAWMLFAAALLALIFWASFSRKNLPRNWQNKGRVRYGNFADAANAGRTAAPVQTSRGRTISPRRCRTGAGIRRYGHRKDAAQ